MENISFINLVYSPKRSRHVKDNLYHVMVGSNVCPEWEIGEAKLHESGFLLVHNEIRSDSLPCVATFHHYPSGSTAVVRDDHPNPNVQIYGSQREVARSSLVELVKPFGFELRESEEFF